MLTPPGRGAAAGQAPAGAPAGRGAPPAAGGGRGRGAFQPPARGPVGYSLQLSMDGTTWGSPVAQGAGETPTTTMTFAPAQATFIRITQTGTAANNEIWGIQQMRVYARTGQ